MSASLSGDGSRTLTTRAGFLRQSCQPNLDLPASCSMLPFAPLLWVQRLTVIYTRGADLTLNQRSDSNRSSEMFCLCTHGRSRVWGRACLLWLEIVPVLILQGTQALQASSSSAEGNSTICASSPGVGVQSTRLKFWVQFLAQSFSVHFQRNHY